MKRLMLLSLLCVLPSSVHAQQIWTAWQLDLGDHVPPSHFVLTVTSPTGALVPPPLQIPWAACPGLPDAQHCTPIGCPPAGTYEFSVVAHYEDGDSAPSNLARCTVAADGACRCTQSPPDSASPLPPHGVTVPSFPPQAPPGPPPGLVLSSVVPPLQPLGPVPVLSTIPAIPPSAGT